MRPEWVHFAGVQESGPEQEEVGKVAEANPQAVNGGHSPLQVEGAATSLCCSQSFFSPELWAVFCTRALFFPPCD